MLKGLPSASFAAAVSDRSRPHEHAVAAHPLELLLTLPHLHMVFKVITDLLHTQDLSGSACQKNQLFLLQQSYAGM